MVSSVAFAEAEAEVDKAFEARCKELAASQAQEVS